MPPVEKMLFGGIDEESSQFSDALEHLRQGTAKQFVSAWTLILSTETSDFTHLLDGVPCTIDVIRSETDDGTNPLDTSSDIVVSKTVTTISVTNFVGKDRYFQVRAF